MIGSNTLAENEATDFKIALSKKFLPIGLQEGDKIISINDIAATKDCVASLNNFLKTLSFLEDSKFFVTDGEKTFHFPLTAQDVLNLFYLARKRAKSLKIRSRLAERKNIGLQLGRPAKNRNDEDIHKLRQQGLTLREIALTLKISISAVQRSLEFK